MNYKPLSKYLFDVLLVLAQIFNQLFSLKQNSGSSVLCYHSISNDGWGFSTSIEDFYQQIKYLSKNKKIVTIDEIINKKRGENEISVTFDDGYKDFFTNALPILKRHNIRGTLFVLGTPHEANRNALGNNKILLSTADIKSIKKAGWEIGFHTNTHTSLTSLTTEQLKKEIIDGKKNLEKKLGFKLRYFAYPMGEYSPEVVEIVKQAGFEAAFSTNGGEVSINNASDMHIIDRVCLEGNLTLNQFKTLITPLGLLFNKSFINLLKVKVALTNVL